MNIEEAFKEYIKNDSRLSVVSRAAESGNKLANDTMEGVVKAFQAGWKAHEESLME